MFFVTVLAFIKNFKSKELAGSKVCDWRLKTVTRHEKF